MTEFLYKFRSIEALLGEYKELENQEIYFASPNQLNDPIEGFMDIFWKGDEIVWKNFIKHYLFCLHHTCISLLISQNIGCEIFSMPKLPPNLTSKKDSYIWTTENNHLYYIKEDGNKETVPLVNVELFKNEFAKLNITNQGYNLSRGQIDLLITSNGGHVYRRFDLIDDDIPVLLTIEDLKTDAHKEMLREIYSLFFKSDKALAYPKLLASRKRAIRRDELLFHLQSIYPYALNCIFTIFKENKLMPEINFPNTSAVEQLLDSKRFEMINKMEDENLHESNITEKFYAQLKNNFLKSDLRLLSDTEMFLYDRNKRFVFLEFPARYIKQLNKIIHYKWYTACFSSSYDNSAMWGYYGNNHRGVCLKFKTQLNSESKPTIKLRYVVDSNGNKGNNKLNYSWQDFIFYKVDYNRKYPEIDFFCSIGRLPTPVLMKYWYMDENKNISVCANIYKQQEWITKYWNDFYSGITAKLVEWGHEQEYRLVFPSSGDQNAEQRKLKYNFSDLEGIIFGIETTVEDKMRITKIVAEKCKNENRNNFNFYQAYYCHQDGKFKIISIK